MSSPASLSSPGWHSKPELPSWVRSYVQNLRENAESRACLWPQDPLVPALLTIADEIEEKAYAYALEQLTLRDAAVESGYSYSAVQKMVASGELENLGDKGSPRVRRCDLPKKHTQRVLVGEPDLAGMILDGRDL